MASNETLRRMREFTENSLLEIKAWEDSGVVKEFEIITSGRTDVCRFCDSQRGGTISMTNAKVGENIPPFHSCLNFNTSGCCCGFRPVVDTGITL